jgi:hypothetical protein
MSQYSKLCKFVVVQIARYDVVKVRIATSNLVVIFVEISGDDGLGCLSCLFCEDNACFNSLFSSYSKMLLHTAIL